MTATDSTHNLVEPKKEMVRGELCIERLPEIFNRQAYKGGIRTIVRRNQKLEIGLPDWKGGFSHHEYLVFLEVLQMWAALGCPDSGDIYKENNRLSLSEFTDNLYGDERKYRTGGNYRTKVEKWIKNLLRIPMLHHVYTPLANGDVKVSLGSFTFLIAAEGIMSKQGRYFDLSRIKIHPTIVKSIKAHQNIKPVRLDVVRELHGDNEVLFYREIDLILSKRNEFDRPLIPFCNDLGIQYKHERDYASKSKKICKGVNGKALSSGGIIGFCFIESRADGYYIVARKEHEVKSPPKKIEAKPKEIVAEKPDEDKVRYEAHVSFLEKHYGEFSSHERNRVEEIYQELMRVAPYSKSPLTQKTCRHAAIESVLKQEIAKEKIYHNSHMLIAREGPTPGTEYMPDAHIIKRKAMRKLASILRALSDSKMQRDIII